MQRYQDGDVQADQDGVHVAYRSGKQKAGAGKNELDKEHCP